MFLCLYFDILAGTHMRTGVKITTSLESFNSSTKEVSFECYIIGFHLQNQKLTQHNFVVDFTIKEVRSPFLLTLMNRLRTV